MEPVEGFEPPASCLQNNRSATELHRHKMLLGWQTLVLPNRLWDSLDEV